MPDQISVSFFGTRSAEGKALQKAGVQQVLDRLNQLKQEIEVGTYTNGKPYTARFILPGELAYAKEVLFAPFIRLPIAYASCQHVTFGTPGEWAKRPDLGASRYKSCLRIKQFSQAESSLSS